MTVPNYGRTDFLYTLHVNRLHGRSGHLWQNRFYSCALGETHAWRALRYVERNPVRGKLVRVAWRYPWSSAPRHCGQADPIRIADPSPWQAKWDARRWQETLREADDAEEISRLLLCTHRGRPLASDSFLSRLEHKLGRRLRPLPVGRPRRAKAKKPAKRGAQVAENR